MICYIYVVIIVFIVGKYINKDNIVNRYVNENRRWKKNKKNVKKRVFIDEYLFGDIIFENDGEGDVDRFWRVFIVLFSVLNSYFLRSSFLFFWLMVNIYWKS